MTVELSVGVVFITAWCIFIAGVYCGASNNVED